MEEKNEQNEEIKKEEVAEPTEAEFRIEDEAYEQYQPTPEEIARKKKRDFKIELALIFILGVLVGIAIKSEAVKKITIGYDDYKMKIHAQDYNINQLQADILKKQEDEARKLEEEQSDGLLEEGQGENQQNQ